MKSPCQLSRARQPLPRPQVVAEDPKNNLRHELFAQRYRALMCKPKLHRASILTLAVFSMHNSNEANSDKQSCAVTLAKVSQGAMCCGRDVVRILA